MSPETRNTVLQGIEEARQRQFAVAPDLEADLAMSQRTTRTAELRLVSSHLAGRTMTLNYHKVSGVLGLISSILLYLLCLLIALLPHAGCGKKFTAVPSTQPITRAAEIIKVEVVAAEPFTAAEGRGHIRAAVRAADVVVDESQKLDRANARLITERDEAVAAKDRAEAKSQTDLADAKIESDKRWQKEHDDHKWIGWALRTWLWIGGFTAGGGVLLVILSPLAKLAGPVGSIISSVASIIGHAAMFFVSIFLGWVDSAAAKVDKLVQNRIAKRKADKAAWRERMDAMAPKPQR
jgi:hypothetical protein